MKTNLNEDYYKKVFSCNLRKYMKLYDKTQADLIEDLKLNRSSVSTWVNGTRLPRMDKVDMLANYFNVNRSSLMEEKDVDETYAIKIPILGTVIAGMPISAYQDILGFEEITPEMAAQGEHYALRVTGDSMYPQICDGDIVLVRVQSDVESEDVAVVFVNGDEATLKKVKKEDKGITIYGYNSAVYEPHFFTNEEIKKLPITISGKVVELRRSF